MSKFVLYSKCQRGNFPPVQENRELLKLYEFLINIFIRKSNLYDLILQSKYTYTQSFCLQQCYQELLYKECNCLDSGFASLRNTSYCSNPLQLYCQATSWSNVYFKNDYIQKSCIPQCPLECDIAQFTYMTSSNDLFPSGYMSYLKRNPNLSSDFINRSINDENVILKSIVKLNIF